MDAGANYRYHQTKLDLDEVKQQLDDYLNLTYDTKEEAQSTWEMLEDVVDRICKKQEYTIEFAAGGSPEWHIDILKLVSEWLELEKEIGIQLSQAFSEAEH